MQRQSIEGRFWAKVDKSGECWVWTGAKRGKPPLGHYGSFHAISQHTPAKAHRVSYEMANGPIPAGLWVLHHCDNPPCVRPSHLFLGSPQDNIADSSAKGRRNRSRNPGSKNGIARLTEDQVRSIRVRAASGDSLHWIAADYGVCWGTIRYAVKGGGWKHVA